MSRYGRLRVQTDNSVLHQHSPAQSVLLHLLPGGLIGAGYFVAVPLFRQWGYPSLMALMCAVAFILVPVELGYLLYEGKKRNGCLSLHGLVAYRLPLRVGQYCLWVPGLFVMVGLVFTIMKPVDAFLQQALFFWVPGLEGGLQAGYTREALIGTYLMVAIFGAVVGPVVEEVYFRGYLLPRMGYAGKWAPLLHSLLFALYHLWTPWMFVTRTLGMLPLIFAVQRRNLNLAIAVHVLVNWLDVVAGASFILGLSGWA